jgi:hypothetical protein
MYKFFCTVITIGFSSFLLAQGPYTLSYNLSQFEFSVESGYDRVKGIEMTAVTDTGAPELPVKYLNFILPNATKVQNVEILSLSLVPVSGTYNIYPTQPRVPLSAPPPPWVEPDSLIYSKDEFYPDSIPIKVTHRGSFSGIPMVTIAVYPLLYNPVRDSLYLVQSVTFRFIIESVPLSRRPQIMGERIFQIYKNSIKSSVYNYWEVDAYYTPPLLIPDEQLLSRGGMEVVIIATSTMAGAYQPLAQWLVEKGMPTMIVSIDWIYLMYDGDWNYTDYAGWSEEHIGDDAAKVKEFLYDAHWRHGLAFAILGGSDNTEFPFRFCWGLDNLELRYHTYIPPADLYFQVFYGEWDSDEDQKIGEPVGDDPGYIPNIFIGRVPAWNYDQALSWIEKRLTYEKSPANRELTTQSLWICQENYPPEFHYFRDWMEITKQYFPNYYTQHQLVDFLCDPEHHELIDTLNIGYGIASHYGHGSPDGLRTNTWDYGSPYKQLLLSWEYGNFPSLDELSNVDKYYVFYSFGCITSPFDSFAQSDWNGHWNGDIYPCVSEGFVSFYRLDVPPDQRPAIGAVAYIGNTRHIYPYESLVMHRSFLRNLFDVPSGYIIGISHANSKYSDGFVDWNWAYMNNLFGSPEMPVWTDNPKDLIANHPEAIPANIPVNFTVVVKNGEGNPVQNALVTLYKEGPEVYQSQLTNAEGKAYFSLNVFSTGIMKVTVTKHNYIPYQGNVQVFEFDVNIPTAHTAFTEGRKLVRQPNTENLHHSYTYVEFPGIEGPDLWSYYSLSIDGGTTWEEGEGIQEFCQNPSIDLTSDNRPCIAYRNAIDYPWEPYDVTINFARKDPVGWVTYEIAHYEQVGLFHPSVSPPSIAVDADNICHMVYSGVLYAPGKAYVIYKRFDVFNPATETFIVDSASVPLDWQPSSPSIDLEITGEPSYYPHIVWDFPPEAGEPVPDVWYRCSTSTSWSNKVNISDSYTLPSEHPFIYITNEKAVVVWSEEEEVGNEESREIWKGERFLNQPPEDWTIWREVETPNQASDWPVITANDKMLVWSEHQFIDGEQNWEIFYKSPIYGSGNLSNTIYTQSSWTSCDWRQTLTSLYLYTTYTETYEYESEIFAFGIKSKKNVFYPVPIPIPLYSIYAGGEISSPYLIQRDGYIAYENYSVDYDTTELVYQFTGLNPDLKYRLDVTAYHESSGEWREWVKVDNTAQHLIKYEAGIPKTVELPVPPAAYMNDGEIVVRIPKISGEFAMITTGHLYEFEKEQEGGPQSVMSIPLNLVFGLKVHPNILSRTARLQFTIPEKQHISLKLYDIVGRKVSTITDGIVEPGIHTYNFDPSNLSQGIYFLILNGDKNKKTQKILVVR